MKVTLLSITLLLGACQSTDTVSSSPINPPAASALEAPPAASPAPAAAKMRLPRWNHLDRAQFAVRDWVRDRG